MHQDAQNNCTKKILKCTKIMHQEDRLLQAVA